jgi:hypothetical protein
MAGGKAPSRCRTDDDESHRREKGMQESLSIGGLVSRLGTIPATIKIENTRRYRQVLWLGDLDSNQG